MPPMQKKGETEGTGRGPTLGVAAVDLNLDVIHGIGRARADTQRVLFFAYIYCGNGESI